MDKKRSTHTSTRPKLAHGQSATKAASRKARGDCDDSESSSHTHIFRREKYRKEYKRITSDEFVGISESISGSSDTFQCVHGPEGKLYTPEGQLKRNLVKELDPIRIPRKWTSECKPVGEQELAQALEFLVTDAAGQQLTDRIETYLRDLAATTRHGYNIKVLNSLCVVLDYLMDNLKRKPNLREGTILLLKNMDKPILLTLASDVVSQFDTLTRYVEFLGRHLKNVTCAIIYYKL
ncbi:unnamed protein product [Euphydryas editha]|uniref:Uncharacterized protein n=1 Tax=Euphydryas editha TaxID=104508 RepID=A0AAU9UYP6_EUPED|nr:unnamed protein product [Euphydryas editha]